MAMANTHNKDFSNPTVTKVNTHNEQAVTAINLRIMEDIKSDLKDLVREFTAATELEIDAVLFSMNDPVDKMQYLIMGISTNQPTWHGVDAAALNMVADIRREICLLKLSSI